MIVCKRLEICQDTNVSRKDLFVYKKCKKWDPEFDHNDT